MIETTKDMIVCGWGEAASKNDRNFGLFPPEVTVYDPLNTRT